MYFCTVVSGSDTLHENSLILENTQDVERYGVLREEALDIAIEHVIASALNDGSLGDGPLYFAARKHTTDGIAILAASECENILDWNSVASNHLQEQLQTMDRYVNTGCDLVVNAAGGYFMIKKDEIKAKPSMIQCKRDVTEEALDDFVVHGKIQGYKSTVKYFCFTNNKTCIYEPVFLHDVMLRLHKYNVDKAYKFIYYTTENAEHRLWCDFGIQGLRASVVYDNVEAPFELSSTDLNDIEKFIRERFENVTSVEC